MRNSLPLLWGGACLLGLLVGLQDARSVSDDGALVTLLLLVVSAGVLGFAEPHKAWRWAIPVGLGLSVVHIAARALGYHDHIQPDTYAARLLLAPVGLLAALAGAYCGALLAGLRRRFFPRGL